jgi:hypothetical protein
MAQVDTELLVLIGRLDGKVDAILAQLSGQSETIEQHAARISKLEQGKAWLLGAAAALSAVVSYLAKVLA